MTTVDLLKEVLPRLGATGMVHNGHLNGCPLSYPDWIASDACTCGRDDLIVRVVQAIRDGGQDVTTERTESDG